MEKILKDGRIRGLGVVWQVTRILLRGRNWTKSYKNFKKSFEMGDVANKLVWLKRITDGDLEKEPSEAWRFCVIFGKNNYFNGTMITFCTFFEPFEITKFCDLKDKKKFFSIFYLQVKSKSRLNSCILGLNFVSDLKAGSRSINLLLVKLVFKWDLM